MPYLVLAMGLAASVAAADAVIHVDVFGLFPFTHHPQNAHQHLIRLGDTLWILRLSNTSR